MRRSKILLLFFLIGLSSCNSDDQCEEAFPCALPTGQVFEFNFVLLDENNEIIQLTNSDLANIKFETQELEEKLVLIETHDRIFTLLFGLNQYFEPQTSLYTLTTPFGEPQLIEIIVSSTPADECGWCDTYFINEIVQNSQDTIFSGKLANEIISIKIN